LHIDDWLLTSHRAAVHLPTATAVIADLHLGYDRARRRGGEAVPLRGVTDCLQRLRRLVVEVEVRRLVIAGDLLEDGRHGPVDPPFVEGLTQLGLTDWVLVPGNHDRALGGLPLAPDGVMLGRWRVVHGDGLVPDGPVVQGHLHPCLRLRGGLAAPCYLVGKDRLVLPAFSPDAAGVQVVGQPYRCCVIAGAKVLDLGVLTKNRLRPGGSVGPR